MPWQRKYVQWTADKVLNYFVEYILLWFWKFSRRQDEIIFKEEISIFKHHYTFPRKGQNFSVYFHFNLDKFHKNIILTLHPTGLKTNMSV